MTLKEIVQIEFSEESLKDSIKRSVIAKQLPGKKWQMTVAHDCDGYVLLSHEQFSAEVHFLKNNIPSRLKINDQIEVAVSVAFNYERNSWFFSAQEFGAYTNEEARKSASPKSRPSRAKALLKSQKPQPVHSPTNQKKNTVAELPHNIQSCLPLFFALCKNDETHPKFKKAKELDLTKPNFRENDRLFLEKCLAEIKRKQSERYEKTDHALDTNKRIELVEILTQEVLGLESNFKLPGDLQKIYDKYREIERLQLDSFFPDVVLPAELEDFLPSRSFTGTIDYKSAGFGLVKCSLFKYPVIIFNENLLEGIIREKAQITFKAELFLTNGMRPAFKAVFASSTARKEFSPCIVKISESIPPAQENAIISGLSAGKPVLTNYSKNNNPQIRTAIKTTFPNNKIYHGNTLSKTFGPFIHRDLLENCSLIADKKLSEQENFNASVVSTLLSYLPDKIILQEKNDWVVVMDETGDCKDHLKDCEGLTQPSAMIAVIIPPGSDLPKCPIGYHSIESSKDVSNTLRRNILHNDKITIFVWPYDKANPYSRSDATPELHAQMWRHAVTLCLEFIAQQVTHNKFTTNLRIYIEQQGANTAGSEPLQQHTRRLLDQLQQRDGWKLLNVYDPAIIRKDEHPWLGYADCLGHVFKTDPKRCTDDELNLFKQLKSRPKTISFPYDQKALEKCDAIISLSANEPLDALKILSNTTESHYRPFFKILDPLAQCCINRLSSLAIEHLVNEIAYILSEKPDAYYSAQRVTELLGSFPESLPEVFAISQEINRLSGANKRGDTTEAAVRITAITPIIDQYNKGLRYRFLANYIDYCQNSLNFEKAVSRIYQKLNNADADLADIETAAHCIGGHMQTLAHLGELDAALGYWERLYKVQKSTADRIRYLTYKISLHYDKKNLEEAIECTNKILQISGFESNAQAAENNPYLAAALLKLEYSKAFLPEDDRMFLLHRLDVSKYHPGQLINFWRILLLRKDGSEYSKSKALLVEQLQMEQPCEALWLIMACIGGQLVHNQIFEKQDVRYDYHELVRSSASIADRQKKFPICPDEPLGFLNPLRFNFI